jgi:colanic acid/amylovoran biosynthesis protein
VKALVLNTHSALNSGDLAIVLAQAQYLNERFPGIRLTLTSRTPGVDRTVYRSRRIEVIPPLIPAPSVFETPIQKFQGSLGNLLDFESKSRLRREILGSDFVISSGGGYFYTSRWFGPGPMFLQNLAQVMFSYQLKKPVVFFPQSFGPIHNALSLRLLGKLLRDEKALRVYAREDISLNFLKRYLEVDPAKIDLCPDMAFYLGQEDLSGTDRISIGLPKPVVALTLRSWNFPEVDSRKAKKEKTNAYLKCLEEVCTKLHETWKASFCIFPQVKGPGRFEDDRVISLKFRSRLQKVIPGARIKFLNPNGVISPFRLMHLLSQTDLIIATRFHSALLALLVGTPAIAITYQPKSLGMMSLLNLERFSVDIRNMDADNVSSLAECLIVRPDDVKRKINREVERNRQCIRLKLEREFQ